MDIPQNAIDRLRKVFKKQPEIMAVYFYGSQMTGNSSKSSDLDLAIVTEKPGKINYGDLYLKINQILKKIEVDLRIISKQTSPTFIFQVIKTGKCIYQRNEQEKVRFEAKALDELYDGQHLRDIYDSYLKSYFERS